MISSNPFIDHYREDSLFVSMSASGAQHGMHLHWPVILPAKSIAISIVDDDRLVLRTMQQVLQRSGLFRGIRVFGSAVEVLANLTPGLTQVVLMDILMPGMSGIECTRRIKARFPEVKILMVTSMVDTDTMTQALRAGADGYLIKPFTATEGLQAIQLALCGGAPMSKRIVHELKSDYGGLTFIHRKFPAGLFRSTLEDRETDVMQLLARGKLYKEIALHLEESSSMVSKLVQQIYRKLGVNNRTEATRRWLQLNQLHSPKSKKPARSSPVPKPPPARPGSQ